jgi:hypothetical protein
MRTTAALLGAGALFAASAALAIPASAQEADAQLSVLHGVPDLTVDVYVNGELTLDDFEPGDLAGPLDLPAGTYTVAITAADATDDSEPAIGPVDLPLEGGMNYTAVAFLDADGNPTAALFDNDTSAAGAGEGKLTARHVAAAPEVDVIVAGGSVGTFVNGEQIGPAALAAGEYDVVLEAGGEPVPTTPSTDAVPVTEGVNTIAYAWGEASDLQIAVQTVNLGHSSPSGVPGGESGSAATTVPGWIFAAAGLGLAGVALSSRRLSTTRR